MTSEQRRKGPVVGPGTSSAGWLLSRIGGNDEEVLAHVPAEKSRASALGGVVLGTALLSALEMYLLIHTVNDGFAFLALVAVPAWFAFILSFDRLLMIKLSGGQWTSKLKMTAPRVALAILFGFVLAEPLLLTIFHTAIEERIRSERAATVSNAEASYQRCNALASDGRRAGQNLPECREYLLSVTADVVGPTDELTRTKQSLDTLQKNFADVQAAYDKMTQRTWRECNGLTGDDVTGRPGVGPECRNFRNQQDLFYRANQIAVKGEQVKLLQDKLPMLEQDVRLAVQLYTEQVGAQTSQALNQIRATQQEIGLLERMASFDELRADNRYLTTATWFLRLFLTAIECAPVIVKLSSDKTAYDDVLDATLRSQQTIAMTRIKRTELDTTYGDRLAVEERQQDLKDEQQKLRRRDRSRDLQSDIDLDHAIRQRAEQLRSQKAKT
ncbi:DUF4407 domain-containing protein [Micromonospora sp. NPDC005205]|uniref:DUF4407 domain-containing protein n=1 Tax=Micromonospora sp. NPDC005205 TaxID=3156714 RepID=UPI0033A16CDE